MKIRKQFNISKPTQTQTKAQNQTDKAEPKAQAQRSNSDQSSPDFYKRSDDNSTSWLYPGEEFGDRDLKELVSEMHMRDSKSTRVTFSRNRVVDTERKQGLLTRCLKTAGAGAFALGGTAVVLGFAAWAAAAVVGGLFLAMAPPMTGVLPACVVNAVGVGIAGAAVVNGVKCAAEIFQKNEFYEKCVNIEGTLTRGPEDPWLQQSHEVTFAPDNTDIKVKIPENLW